MKVSIITATYNSAAYIAEALRSIQTQTYLNIELVLIDGGSRDATVKIVNEVFTRDKIVVSEKDKGIYDALNKGISKCTGDIIGFVHSDDLLASPNTINDIVNSFLKQNVDGVYGDLKYVSKENPHQVIRYWKSKTFKNSLLKKGWMPAHPTLFLKKEVYEKHGTFNTHYKIAADYDLMLRIFSDPRLNFFYLPEVITLMRVGGASNRSLKNVIQKSKEDLKTIRRNNLGYPFKVLFYKNFSKLIQFAQK